LVLVGVVVGLIASLGLGRLLGALLFDVAPSDPITMFAVALILLAIAFGAAVLPARRATRISPTEAFRAE
jgi:putative ABC transport system permease protein